MGADIWYIHAQLYKLHNVPEILYIMDDAQESATPTLDTVLLWLREPAELHLKELEEDKRGVATFGHGPHFPETYAATETDKIRLKAEISLTKEFERLYEEFRKKFWKDHGFSEKMKLVDDNKASFHCIVFEAHRECKLEGCICECHKK